MSNVDRSNLDGLCGTNAVDVDSTRLRADAKLANVLVDAVTVFRRALTR